MDWKNKYLQLKYGGAPEDIVERLIYNQQSELYPCPNNYSNFSHIDFK